MIILTLSPTGEIFVNEELVRYFLADDDGCTRLVFSENHEIRVTDDVDEIAFKMLDEETRVAEGIGEHEARRGCGGLPCVAG